MESFERSNRYSNVTLSIQESAEAIVPREALERAERSLI